MFNLLVSGRVDDRPAPSSCMTLVWPFLNSFQSWTLLHSKTLPYYFLESLRWISALTHPQKTKIVSLISVFPFCTLITAQLFLLFKINGNTGMTRVKYELSFILQRSIIQLLLTWCQYQSLKDSFIIFTFHYYLHFEIKSTQ